MAQEFVEQADRFPEILRGKSLDVPMGVHQAFPGTEFVGVLRLRSLDFRRHNSRRDCAGNLICHFVLDGENVFERAVITIGPDVMPVGGVDQLRVDADPVPGFPHAAFKHVTDTKLAPHLPNVDRLALVGEGRIARDDEQPSQSGQRCDDILGDAIRKILLFGIAAHVLEGEHCDRWLAGQCERCCRDCRFLIGSKPIDSYRPRDILEFLLAAILERGVELAAHLPVGIIGYADAAGLGDTFKPGSNVDAVAVNIAFFDEGDIYGDGVNIAARLEGIAQPGGICISDDAYRQVRGKLDASFEDGGEQELKNIARPVRVYWLRSKEKSAIAPTTLALPIKPSIAVLAFQNMSGDPEQEYFADGIAEDVITALSRLRWLFVVARNSSFTYKGKSVDVRHVGRELGVRYVLEGSVRKTGNRVRISAQLIDASDGHHVWVDRYDRALEDIFAVQDEMTNQITSAIAPGIVAAEVLRAQAKDAGELSTWERLMQAHWHIQRFTPEDFREAIRLLDDLLRNDPNNATALSDLAFALHFSGSFAWADDPAAAFARSGEVARRAVASDDKDAAAHAMAAMDPLTSRAVCRA